MSGTKAVAHGRLEECFSSNQACRSMPSKLAWLLVQKILANPPEAASYTWVQRSVNRAQKWEVVMLCEVWGSLRSLSASRISVHPSGRIESFSLMAAPKR